MSFQFPGRPWSVVDSGVGWPLVDWQCFLVAVHENPYSEFWGTEHMAHPVHRRSKMLCYIPASLIWFDSPNFENFFRTLFKTDVCHVPCQTLVLWVLHWATESKHLEVASSLMFLGLCKRVKLSLTVCSYLIYNFQS